MPLTRFDVEGDTVYVADWDELGIYKRNGDSFSKTGSISMSAAVDVEVIGTVAFVADFLDGLKIVDVADSSAPSVIGSEWVVGLPDSIAVHGNNVYVGTGLLGVQVINAEDLSNPTWEDNICVADVVVDVSVSGNYLLVGDVLNGVEIFAIGRDGAAEQIGSYTSWGWVEDAVVHGSKMYVKDFGGMLEVVDLRTPSSPRREEVLLTGGDREVSMRLGHDTAVLPAGWKLKAYDVEVVE